MWGNEDKGIGSIFQLLECFEHVLKLRREEELSFFLLRFLAEEEEEHESIQFFTVFFLHGAHHVGEGLVLRGDGFILLH